MGKCREIDHKGFAKALLLSLQMEFEKLLDDNGGKADTSSKEFATIKVSYQLVREALYHLQYHHHHRHRHHQHHHNHQSNPKQGLVS